MSTCALIISCLSPCRRASAPWSPTRRTRYPWPAWRASAMLAAQTQARRPRPALLHRRLARRALAQTPAQTQTLALRRPGRRARRTARPRPRRCARQMCRQHPGCRRAQRQRQRGWCWRWLAARTPMPPAQPRSARLAQQARSCRYVLQASVPCKHWCDAEQASDAAVYAAVPALQGGSMREF